MKKTEAVRLLREGGKKSWNHYRADHPNWRPDLSNETIGGDLTGVDLSNANLCGADFSKAILYSRRYPAYQFAPNRVILKHARIDLWTRFPTSFDPVDAGAVLVSTIEERMVFISHAWADDKVVTAIDTWLRGAGLFTSLDKRDFFAGERIRDAIIRVMKPCGNIIIFHSKKSENKPWPEFETELADDLCITAKKEGRKPPRVIYVILDDACLPNISQKNRIAIFARGKLFEEVCEEIVRSIVGNIKKAEDVDLNQWRGHRL